MTIALQENQRKPEEQEKQAKTESERHEETVVSLFARIERGDLLRVSAVVVLAVVAGIVQYVLPPARWSIVLLMVVTAVGLVGGCWPIARESIEDIRQHRMSMDLSMLIAIVAAAAIGQWTTSLVIVVFVLVAEILEDLCMDRGRSALTDLMAFLPATVRIRTGSQVHDIKLSDVEAGMILVISPGGRIPVDGVVVSGESSVDQSRVTGESVPVSVTSGDSVFSGSINQDGAMEVKATKVGDDSSYGRIVSALRDAQNSQAPVQRLADRLAMALVSIAIVGAIITWLVSRDLTNAISVIIVAGACGVAAGTPLALLASMARAARSGAFVKDGLHLEVLSEVDTVVFDKTGTLTTGVLSVRRCSPEDGVTEEKLLALAASAESYSEHLIGEAVAAEARRRGVATQMPERFENAAGRGVAAVVDGHEIRVGRSDYVTGAQSRVSSQHSNDIHVSFDGRYLGSISFEDTVRQNSSSSLTALRRLGLRVIMLTGDHRDIAARIGKQLGIDDVRADLLPDDKLAVIRHEREAGHRVVMIGDGVNDAPSLAAANVGIAMGSGTDIATDSANIVLISSDLKDLVSLIETARRARNIIMFNFVGTIVVDVIGMALASIGVLTPILSAIVHVGSESAFILNSARLIPTRHVLGSEKRKRPA